MDAATSIGAVHAKPDVTLEVRSAATSTLIPTIRTVAADLAARADFDLDAIADLRMAVDEVCATLIGVASPESKLTCTFTVMPDRIEVDVTIPLPAGSPSRGAMIATDTFGWRVLQTLADKVLVVQLPGSDGGPDQIGIRLDKRAVTDSR
ncbi:MAG: ATP-binding protein [Pseudonocardiaceae bacterium]